MARLFGFLSFCSFYCTNYILSGLTLTLIKELYTEAQVIHLREVTF